MSSTDTSGIKAPAAGNLYRLEHYIDPASGAGIEVQTPMKLLALVAEPVADAARKTRFFSQVILAVGPTKIPWRFEIEAESLSEALEKFIPAASAAAMQAAGEIESQQRRAILAGSGFPGRAPN